MSETDCEKVEVEEEGDAERPEGEEAKPQRRKSSTLGKNDLVGRHDFGAMTNSKLEQV